MKKRGNKIIISMFIIMLCVLAYLTVNIFSASVLQVHLRSKEDITNYSGNSTSHMVIKSHRGTIYDSKGSVIAEDITSYNLIAYLSDTRVASNGKPHYVVDINETANFLSSLLGNDSSYYANLMDTSDNSKTQTEFGPYGKGLDLKTKTAIEESELPGLEFTVTSKRHYPYGQFSSQLIGFSDLDQEADRQVGKMGLELHYDELLTGKDGTRVSTVTSKGYTLPNTTSVVTEAKNGDNLYLTLNKNIQSQLEDSLDQSMQMDKTDKAWGMVLDVKTGKILAIGQSPTFDPEIREDIEYLFYPTSFAYEPGSTMKAVAYAAAIEEGFDINKTFNSNSIYLNYDAEGKPVRVSKDGKYSNVINNAGLKSWGTIDYKTGFAVSSNVGLVEMMINGLPSSKFEEYLDKFKFFEPSVIDGMVGSSGLKSFNYPIDKVTNFFGQGSTVTMLQMAQAFGAIVNDGKMMKPYVVEQILDSDNLVVHQGKPEQIAQPISKETSELMREIMAGVIEGDLNTGKNYQLDEIEQIAKTGTAQVVIDGKYSTSRYISSIGTAFPKDDPEYLVFYAYESLNSPSNYFKGAEPIKELVLKVADEFNLIDSNNIDNKDDSGDDIIVSEMPNLINHSLDYANKKLESSNVDIVVIGDGDNIINQYPNAVDKIISNQTIILYTGAGKITMPDMTGWSRREVVAFWNASGASFLIDGNGNVVNQSVPKGTIIDPNTEVKVILR